MTKHTTSHVRRRNRRFLAAMTAMVALLALPMVGCGDLLEVVDPDIVTPENLEDDLGLTTLRNGAVSNFQQAWSANQAGDNIVVFSGLMTDEWFHSGTFPTRQEVDRRELQVENTTLDGLFFRLQRARADLERGAIRIERAVPDPNADARIPELQAYAGFTYIAFGENFCNGVPFSETLDSILFGDPLTNVEMFNRAVALFDAALAHGAVDSDIANMARVGKGRALLNLDQAGAAATAVAAVPDDFVFYNWHSNTAARARNGIYHLNPEAGRWSVADNLGANGLPFRSAMDPRVPWADVGIGFDSETPLYQFMGYTSREDSYPLATGVEARLIEAEADLQAGGANLVTILNGLRQNFATTGPLLYPENPLTGALADTLDPGSATAREDLLFYERAFWLYGTGHRLGDLRRLIRQYGRGSETVFPTGAYHKSGSYGVDVNIPVPQPEENNPNFQQCLDRNP
jgi:hypothetical protein